jgi:hypothetical protein
MEDQKLKRREVLQLYRWCGDGSGLALWFDHEVTDRVSSVRQSFFWDV